jgi:TetR/AcrR family transcriptional repressor of mexJK operon
MNFISPKIPAPGRPKDLEKRAAILDAAMRLFPARGYDGVSMDAIAQAAGVSKLTVYNHFEDKESLFCAAIATCCEQLLPTETFQSHPDLPLRDALVSIGHGFIDLVMDERAVTLHRMMITQAGQDQRLTELFFAAGPRRTLDAMEAFLRHAVQAGQLQVAEPAHAAEHFFCLLKGVRHLRVLVGMCPLPDADERHSHVAEVVDLFLRAYAVAVP